MKLYIRKLKKGITISVTIALVIILTEIFYSSCLKDTKVWSVIYNLSLSYISAFIFYFLVVHIKEQKDKENMKEHTSKYIRTIISNTAQIKKDIEKKSEINCSSKYPNIEELKEIFSKFKIADDAPLITGGSHPNYIYANWFYYLYFYRSKNVKAIEKILSVGYFLDTELIRLIVKIESNPHYGTIEAIKKHMDGGKLLNIESTINLVSLANYFELIKELDEYSESLKK